MFNIFRTLADCLHVIAFIVLLAKLWRTKSSAGISGKTQILFAIVFTMRYTDLLSPYHYHSYYISSMKIAFIALSYLIVYLMYGPYKKTYDRENDVMYNEFLVVPCFVLALFFSDKDSPFEIMWTFSVFLESIAIIPQLELLCKIEFVDNYTSFYLLSLGSYRALYIINWLYRYHYEGYYDVNAITAGFVQTTLFALVFVRLFSLMRREKRTLISVVI
ncbi:ER lumen protein-retaining receptor erd-2.2-like [Topomyia yanbarensis]|uniref:ER lumen protein-retaining receptor erd-2.2-like n=1 Tax=Topomyia yanbarensis TaxID=2498891 RepID=UPI00273CBEFD|nr:ER lumen protein-retaining receptor erd-2.2-like [Topomyia yanbarensis]